jgi:serine/threonine protein kinase
MLVNSTARDGSDAEDCGRPQTIICPNKLGPYVIGATLGQGGCSCVRHATRDGRSDTYACKIISKRWLSSESRDAAFEREVRIHQSVRHPNIVAVTDLHHDSINHYIFLEYCPNRDLWHFLVEKTKLPELEASAMTKQILTALAFLHSHDIAHLDLKLENILLDGHMNPKISDFGLSRRCSPDEIVTTKCGSPFYIAPEILAGGGYRPMIADMWSLGVVVYALVTGHVPWTRNEKALLYPQILHGKYDLPDSLSSPCRDLIVHLLCVDPTRRLTAAQALEHPWIRSAAPAAVPPMAAPMVRVAVVDEYFSVDASGGFNLAVASAPVMPMPPPDAVRRFMSSECMALLNETGVFKRPSMRRNRWPAQGGSLIVRPMCRERVPIPDPAQFAHADSILRKNVDSNG